MSAQSPHSSYSLYSSDALEDGSRVAIRDGMLTYFKVAVGWGEILKRTFSAVNQDDVLALSAGLAYSFFFALFPALIFIVALASFFPLQGLVDQLVAHAGNVVPDQMMALITGQMKQISNTNHGGLLTFGLLLTILSVSSGMAAVIDALNHVYDITESRPWWKVRLISIALVIALSVFLLVSLALVLVGPQLAGRVATWVHLGPEFALAWKILEWPVVFILVVTAVGFVYYWGPDAEQEWVWITPGSLVATVLWILASLGFRLYIAHFNSYNATYGAIGGVMIALFWLYITGIVLLFGAELNAEIEHASPYGKAPGEKVPGQKTGVRRKIGAAAARAWEEAQRLGRRHHPAPAAAQSNHSPAPVTSADKLRPVRRPVAAPGVAMSRERVDTSRKVLGGVIVGEVALALVRLFMRTRTRA